LYLHTKINIQFLSNIGQKGTIKLLNAFTQNIVIEELFLSGNNGTDKTIPILINFLSFKGNSMKILGYGDNSLTENGVILLRDCIYKHMLLTDLQLNSNPIGDRGAEAVILGECI
jgi:Ran GTPase-activating protein (RanGAP) involved in mRNA processing and transport